VKTYFADTSYYLALLLPTDALRRKADAVNRELHPFRTVTTELVLAELLNSLGKHGTQLRAAAVRAVVHLENDPNTTIVPMTRELFRTAVGDYGRFHDKVWSLVDCSSFIVMHDRRLTEALTHDHHFEQAGFRALLRDRP
jgi:predicted nucleic acid-binding protein